MKFERPRGFTGSQPRNWIDKNLPVCPLCKTPALWEIGMEFKFSSYNRYHFRCPNCLAVISTPVPAVAKGLGLYSTLASKKLKIEDAGNNEAFRPIVGEEYDLGTLQEWSKSKDRDPEEET